MVKAIIIDDELLSRKTLGNFIEKYCSTIQVVGEADGVLTGFAQIMSIKPDLVFLDIEMKDGTGFDLLERIGNIDFEIVFVTAFNHFAIKAFQLSALDYILKPVDPSFLVQLEGKLKKRTQLSDLNGQLKILLENRLQFKKVALPSMEGIKMVKIDNIIRCQSDSNYTQVFVKQLERIVVSRTLKEFEDMFGDRFFRIHHSHLINMDYVDSFLKEDGGVVLMVDGTKIPVSRRKKDNFIEKLIR